MNIYIGHVTHKEYWDFQVRCLWEKRKNDFFVKKKNEKKTYEFAERVYLLLSFLGSTLS